MNDGPVKTSEPVASPSKHNVDVVDERIWQAWIEKNRERDRMRFDRRVRIFKYLLPFFVLAALIWKYMR